MVDSVNNAEAILNRMAAANVTPEIDSYTRYCTRWPTRPSWTLPNERIAF
jgi:hypothetical protein